MHITWQKDIIKDEAVLTTIKNVSLDRTVVDREMFMHVSDFQGPETVQV